MKDLLLKYMEMNQNDLGVMQVVEVMLIALALSILVFITYRYTYSGVMYNKKFNVSLVMITCVTTMVMIVIGSNIALSLGMVGALSIVRFRTAIKDPRDTTYIFWAIGIGLCAGTMNFTIALVGSLILTGVLIFFKFGGSLANDRYIMIIRAGRKNEEDIMNVIYKFLKGSHLRSKHTDRDNIELIYQVKWLNKKGNTFVDELYKIEGVTAVNIVSQNGESIG